MIVEALKASQAFQPRDADIRWLCSGKINCGALVHFRIKAELRLHRCSCLFVVLICSASRIAGKFSRLSAA